MKRAIPVLLALLMILSIPIHALAAGAEEIRRCMESTGDYLAALGDPKAGSTGGEWLVMGFARSGRSVPDCYYDSACAYIAEKIDSNERLHSTKASVNCRFIVALTAIGKDPTNVEGHNLLAGLNDMDYIRKAGISSIVWTLIAFDCGQYETPRGVQRDALVAEILSLQTPAGGWANSGAVPDPDMTAMAIQALAPYCGQNAQAKTAVEEAVRILSEMQDETGNFPGQYGASSESTAQVIVALTTLGIDPNRDERFVKNGVSAVDGLLGYYVEGGGFRHIATGKVDGVATEQGYYALTAYLRFVQGELPLYDMRDVSSAASGALQTVPKIVPETIWVWAVLGWAAASLLVCFLLKKKLGKEKTANAVMAVVILTMGALGGGYVIRENREQNAPQLGSLYQIESIPENRLVTSDDGKNLCTVTIRCQTVLDHLDQLETAKVPYVPADGVILPEITVEFTPGETAFGVLVRACDAAGIPMEYSWSPLYDSYYLEGINHLYEFDCGTESGWMYQVNGKNPNYGASSWQVQPGDRIVWTYSCVGLGADA